MKITYILPKNFFFDKGYTGSVVHALGIYKGLKKNGIETVIFAKRIRVKQKIKDYLTNDLLEFNRNKFLKTYHLLKEMKSNKDTKVIVRYAFSQFFYLVFLALLGKSFKIRTILEVNSLMYFHNKYKIKIMKYFELLVCSMYDAIYVVSPNSKLFFEKNGFQGKVFFVPNGILNNEHWNDEISLKEFKPLTFKYFGSGQPYYNFEFVVSNCGKKGYNFEFYGNISDKLKNKLLQHDWFTYKGRYDNNELTSLVNPLTDILVLPYKQNTVAEFGFPTKLVEYIFMKALVLSSDTGVLGNILHHNQNAIVYEDDNLTSLDLAFEAIEQLNGEDCESIVNRSSELLKHLNWNKLVLDIINERSTNI